MTIVEGIKTSVETRNATLAGRIADVLRFKLGFDYEATFQFFHEHTNINRPDFENLMCEVDEQRMSTR